MLLLVCWLSHKSNPFSPACPFSGYVWNLIFWRVIPFRAAAYFLILLFVGQHDRIAGFTEKFVTIFHRSKKLHQALGQLTARHILTDPRPSIVIITKHSGRKNVTEYSSNSSYRRKAKISWTSCYHIKDKSCIIERRWNERNKGKQHST